MGLIRLVIFLGVKLTHSVLNFIFNICVVFKVNYSFSER
jgi:hypothetical protein